MEVKWTEFAECKLRSIFDYYLEVAEDKVAKNMISEIVNSADSLSLMPYKASKEESLPKCNFVYRSLTVMKIFKIVYFIDEQLNNIVISTIWDCRQNPYNLQKEL
jgi:plasmid stabilization system protein ParE